MGNWKKVLDFTATAENMSVINILLILNPKHSNYWEENYLSQNQDKVTLGLAVAEYLGFLHIPSLYLHLPFMVPTVGV